MVKLASLKLPSIPTLEFNDAVVKNQYSISIKCIGFWTYYKSRYSWINSGYRSYNHYVGFGVADILETTDMTQWRKLPSKIRFIDKFYYIKLKNLGQIFQIWWTLIDFQNIQG